jgi:hypothetical protein
MLGKRLNWPWRVLNRPDNPFTKRKTVELISHRSHATYIPSYRPCEKVVYVNSYAETCNVPLEAPIFGPGWYIEYQGKTATITKCFKPSEFTLNPKDDDDKELFSVHDNSQLFFRLMLRKAKFELHCGYDIHEIFRLSESFIGRDTIQPIPFDATGLAEKDHNKSYVAYETSPFYNQCQLPTDECVLLAGTPNWQNPNMIPCVVIISGIRWPESNLIREAYNLRSDPSSPYLNIIYYQFLTKHGAQPIVTHTLYSRPQYFSIVDFSNQFPHVSVQDMKLIRNHAIGNLIAGGVDETKVIVIPNPDETERAQILYECGEHNCIPEELPNGDLRVVYNLGHRSETARFHIHSHIMAYSATTIMQEYISARIKGLTVYAYHCDSLLITDDGKANQQHIGGWKYVRSDDSDFARKIEAARSIYPRCLDHSPRIREAMKLDVSTPFGLPTNRLVIDGAAGVGKSYQFEINPLPSQILLQPTIALRDTKIKEAAERNAKRQEQGLPPIELTIMCYQAYLGTFLETDAARVVNAAKFDHYRNVIYDEYGMMSRKDLKIALERAKQDNANIYLCGDYCQLLNEIEGLPLDRKYLEKNGFMFYEQERTKYSRHSPKDGAYLDYVREGDSESQMAVALRLDSPFTKTNLAKAIALVATDQTGTFRIITGTHARAKVLTDKIMQLRKLTDSIPVKALKSKDNSLTELLPTSDDIWWDKVRMTDKAPKGKSYIPQFAVTLDSVQGSTTGWLIIDINHIQDGRHGSVYTAISRTRKLFHTILITDGEV